MTNETALVVVRPVVSSTTRVNVLLPEATPLAGTV